MHAGSPKATVTIGGFGCFVTSTAAPTATGWSDSCQAGLAPAEDLRLSTAHGTNHLSHADLYHYSQVEGKEPGTWRTRK